MAALAGILFFALVGCAEKRATVQAVEQFAGGRAQDIAYVSSHKATGEGEFQVDEFKDAAGGTYEVAQTTGQVVSYNSMRGGTISTDDPRPSIAFAEAEQIGLQIARRYVRDFDAFAQRAVHNPQPQGKGNTFSLQWIGTVPAQRSKSYYYDGNQGPPPPYRVLATINSKGDLVQFLNETY